MNPYSAPRSPAETRKGPNTSRPINKFIRALLALVFGDPSSLGVAAILARQSFFEPHILFFSSAFLFSALAAYLLIRDAKLWAIAASFTILALMFWLAVNSPNYDKAAAVVAIQSMIQFIWAAICSWLPRSPTLGSDKRLPENQRSA